MGQATLQLSGSLTLQPPSYPPSAAQQIGQPIQMTSYIDERAAQDVTLDADGLIAIPFPSGMTECHFIYMFVQAGGQPIELVLTSADGTAQIIPVDPLAVLYSASVPFTAISVRRTTGVSTDLTYVIAQNQ